MPKATPTDANEESHIHRAVSDDGTGIAGRVHGQGPPLVLVPGGLSDGEIGWRFLLPLLSERFTCFALSTRGKGLSGEPPAADFSRERLLEDVTVFVESLGEPVGLMGHSSGGTLALAAAAQTDAVSSLALYEPRLGEFAGEDVSARVQDGIARAERNVEEAWLEKAMKEGMMEVLNGPITVGADISDVPVEVEIKSGKTWAG